MLPSATPQQSLAILAAAGIVPDSRPDYPTYTRDDGTRGRVDRMAEMVEEAPLEPHDRVVLQVSRWDRLKDPLGVLRAFVEHVAHLDGAHLLLAGPSTAAVADDPEGAEVLLSVQDAWHELPLKTRRRVHLASLPMDDIEENATIVNANAAARLRRAPRRDEVERGAARERPDPCATAPMHLSSEDRRSYR